MTAIDRIRIGAIGTGGIANTHFRNLNTIPGVELTAFCDVARERADEAVAKFNPGARTYDDSREMLAASGIDAVYVCVPPFAHGDIELAVIEAGLPMYVEKPVALSLDVASRVQRAIDQRNALVFVGYHWRYQPSVERVQELLSDAAIGLLYGYYKTRPPMRPGHWLTIKERSGGQIVEQTTHIVDLSRLLAGDVKTVYGRFANRLTQPNPTFTAADVGTATLEFENGTLGTISNCWLAPVNHVSGLELWTDKGVIEFNQRSLRIHKDNDVEDVALPTPPPGVSGHYFADKSFVDAVRTGDRSLIRTPYPEAVKTLAVSLAATESAATGRPISLAELGVAS
ncbi:MAG: Gfo/Idh/MocA family oxidoreductase [Chloroflexi bacterium]|nr:Gfo/Idh/MocA family oxidoreductase [Chloroflexota bacterium]